MDMDTEMAPPPVFTSDPLLRSAMLEEEDARGTGVSGIAFLREGLIAPDAELQRVAVRGIGRLENSQFIPITFPLLFSGDETVRAEAVNALGQATFGSLGDDVADVLFDYLVRESGEGPAVRAVIGRTLGRLRYTDAVRFRRAVETLVDLIFARAGWQRISRVGGTQADTDLVLEQPTTGETAFVQVKSKAGQAVLDDYISRFRRGTYDRLFFICHSPTGTLSVDDAAGIHIWAGDRLADASVKAGLFDWLTERSA